MQHQDLTAVAALLEQAISRMPPIAEAVKNQATLRILRGLMRIQVDALKQRDLLIRKEQRAAGRD